MTLNATTKCDACHAAQAFLRVTKPVEMFGEVEIADLDLCVHHFNRHESHLLKNGWEVSVDLRHTLNSKPSPSANAD